MPSALIDIDEKPYVVVEVSGRVARGDGGDPVFVPDSPSRWLTGLNRRVGQAVRIKLIGQKRQRTLPQNAMLWGLCYRDILDGLRQLAEDCGERPVFEDEDELHDALKWLFLRRKEHVPGAGEIERVPSSAKLTTDEFTRYVEEICRWASERGIYVRHPGEGDVR